MLACSGTILLSALARSSSSLAAVSEAEIKAAMVFNFTKFIEWSGSKGDPKTDLVIGVAGDDELREALDGLARDRAAGRPVQIRQIYQPAGAEPCHLLFLGRRWRKRAGEFTPLARRGVLIVGDSEGFLEAGGAIGFSIVDNKLRFEVNLMASNLAGVTVSSRLLRLATGVRP